MKSVFALAVVALVATNAAARELECEVCRKVSMVVEAVLVRNATVTNTFNTVSGALCDHMPEGLRDTCADAVGALDPDVFRCMIQEADFRSLCSDPSVALCKAPAEPFSADIQCHGMMPTAPSCAACKFSVSGLQQYVNDTAPRTVASIGTDICRFHFKRNDMKQMCRVVMSSFGEIMLRVLASRLDAEDFCCELGVCDVPVMREGEKWEKVGGVAETA